MIVGLDGVDAHQRGFMRFGAIYPKWRAFSEIGIRSFRLYYGHPWLAGKILVRVMQRTQFRAKSATNDLESTDFLNLNIYFETEGVQSKVGLVFFKILYPNENYLHRWDLSKRFVG